MNRAVATCMDQEDTPDDVKAMRVAIVKAASARMNEMRRCKGFKSALKDNPAFCVDMVEALDKRFAKIAQYRCQICYSRQRFDTRAQNSCGSCWKCWMWHKWHECEVERFKCWLGGGKDDEGFEYTESEAGNGRSANACLWR